MAIIEVNGLNKSYGNTVAVEDLNLTVEKGEVLGFLGPNGAGKTTTIRLLAGIIKPSAGYAVVAGCRTDGEVERLHNVIGLLTETPGLYDKLTARRNLEYFAGFYANCPVKTQVEKYLKLMGLWERREDRAGTFSKGLKQRLALARTLIHEPAVIFLDEPTSGLDPESAGEVRQLIKQLSNEGKTIFISTHNLSEAEELCHRIAVIRKKLLVLDTGSNLRSRFFQQEVEIRLESVFPAVVAAVEELAFVKSLKQEANSLVLVLSEPEQNRPELVRTIVEAGGGILNVVQREHPLEEVYLKLIRENN
jgi:ABC-2 type transport system ATP-binding protein